MRTVYLVAFHRHVCESLVHNKSVIHPTAIASCHSESGNWDPNFIRHFLSPDHNLVAYLTMMGVSGLTLPNGEQRRFEPLSNPAGVPNHPTYIELNLANVNPNLAFPRSDRVCGTRKHSTPTSSPFGRRVHATLAITPCPVRE